MATLALSNKHLTTPAQREKAIELTIATSSAIEGIYAPFRVSKDAQPSVKVSDRVVIAKVQPVRLTNGKKLVVKPLRRAKSA